MEQKVKEESSVGEKRKLDLADSASPPGGTEGAGIPAEPGSGSLAVRPPRSPAASAQHEPEAKKLKLTTGQSQEIPGRIDPDVKVKTEPKDACDIDTEIVFNELKANIDLLNGVETKSSWHQPGKLDIGISSSDKIGSTLVEGLEVKVEVKAELDSADNETGKCENRIKDEIHGEEGLESSCGFKVYVDVDLPPENIESPQSLSANTAGDEKRTTDLSTDLDMLAAAAERRQQIDIAQEPGKPPCPGKPTDTGGEKRKSRKQNTPRRIMHMPTEDSRLFGDDDNLDQAQKRKQNKPLRITDGYFDENGFEDYEEFRSNTADIDDEGKVPDDSADESYEPDWVKVRPKSDTHTFTDDRSALTDLTHTVKLPPYMNGGESPLLAGLPYQNEMLATLSQSLYQTTDDQPDQAGISGLEGNLDVVRRLREIRFYKYRKISIAEKREIAAYAKRHSVSAAATHFGVSKSAVSMWARTDFSDVKSDSGKRKRNCMLGNDKFEQLLERVRTERGNKFKGLTKQDKFEVSRYAKLVGVREMARCLGIALGTVSGWMRQYPYTVKPGTQDDDSSNTSQDDKGKDGETSLSTTAEVNEDTMNYSMNMSPDVSVKQENDDSFSSDYLQRKNDSKLQESKVLVNEEICSQLKLKIKKEYVEETDAQSEDSQPLGTKFFTGVATEFLEDSNSRTSNVTLEYANDDKTSDSVDNEDRQEVKTEDLGSWNMDTESGVPLERIDEVDEMIAETLMSPDIDKCYKNIREHIRDTPLENDQFFESLFRRVLSCRMDKYKTLKASEKLEVVRYAKRIGVRRVAKLLGLATGTLSGWTTKYQAHLGLTMDTRGSSPGPDSSQSPSSGRNTPTTALPTGFDNILTPDSTSKPPVTTPQSSALLDNQEKSEVTAIKFLLKEQFAVLQEKIAIARQIKFKNIRPQEKVEIVKCAKLVGIRPTARVLGMPIGNLSGWITKYSNTLHPVYHIDNTDSSEPVAASTSSAVDIQAYSNRLSELYGSDLVGRNVSVFPPPQPGVIPVMAGMNMSPVGIGLVPCLQNGFTPSFLPRLNLNPSLNQEGSRMDGASLSSAQSGEAIHSSPVGGLGIVSDFSLGRQNAGEETRKMAEQYVRMFAQAHLLKR